MKALCLETMPPSLGSVCSSCCRNYLQFLRLVTVFQVKIMAWRSYRVYFCRSGNELVLALSAVCQEAGMSSTIYTIHSTTRGEKRSKITQI